MMYVIHMTFIFLRYGSTGRRAGSWQLIGCVIEFTPNRTLRPLSLLVCISTLVSSRVTQLRPWAKLILAEDGSIYIPAIILVSPKNNEAIGQIIAFDAEVKITEEPRCWHRICQLRQKSFRRLVSGVIKISARRYVLSQTPWASQFLSPISWIHGHGWPVCTQLLHENMS